MTTSSQADNKPQTPERLSFTDEPGSARSKWVAGLLGLGLAGWMGSGYLLPAPPKETAEPVRPQEAVAVAVRDSVAQDVTQVFTAEGQAQPDRRATLRAETSGEVATLAARKGDYLEQGDVIARLSTREQDARVAQAREEVARAQREFDNAETLLARGVSTTDRVTDARAALASAQAQLTQAEEALDAAVIRAPFAGRLDALDLDEGGYVSAGGEVGTMLDTDPLSIVIQIPQQSLSRIKEGQAATVRFITGTERSGTVDYVSKDAESETRTFRAEITVPNPDGDIASGLSVQVEIPTGQMSAHFISPAILSLGSDGRLGVKTVDADNTVVFSPVVLERAQTDGIWVSGLPAQARVITIGQGFVSNGEAVAPTLEEAEVAAAEIDAPATPIPDDIAPDDGPDGGPEAAAETPTEGTGSAGDSDTAMSAETLTEGAPQ
ncbi:MAG: efflux RND transporter periplasmic adaptor subunit [Celeribacter sp.]